jgi:hypothetical protein
MDEELRAHPEWRNFGDEIDDNPRMRGWLARLHLPELRGKVAAWPAGSTSDETRPPKRTTVR